LFLTNLWTTNAYRDYKDFLNFLTGAGTDEGPEAAYRREEELEQARKGQRMFLTRKGFLMKMMRKWR
jgi:hypothetical protein